MYGTFKISGPTCDWNIICMVTLYLKGVRDTICPMLGDYGLGIKDATAERGLG